MEPEFKDKSEKLFISVMKIAMGILAVFSFCYVISAVGLIDWESIFPAPSANPIVLDEHTYTTSDKEEVVIEEEITQKFKEKEKQEEEEDSSDDVFESFFDQYSDKLDNYFNKGFYYDLYKNSQEEQQKNKKSESGNYSQKEEKEYTDNYEYEDKNPYYKDDYGFSLDTDFDFEDYFKKYDFEDMFPWSFNW